jgi:hypothetical protein
MHKVVTLTIVAILLSSSIGMLEIMPLAPASGDLTVNFLEIGEKVHCCQLLMALI